MKGKQRKYSDLFKENAVHLSYKKSNLSEFARELGISPPRLAEWRQTYEKFGIGGFPGCGGIRMRSEDQKIFELEKKLKKSEQNFEIFEKGTKYLLKMGNTSIYQFIKENEKSYSIIRMCSVFGIHRRVYRNWKNGIVSEKKEKIHKLKNEITSLYYLFNKQYGSLKITRELVKRGYKISGSRVAFYMKEMNLYRKPKQKFKLTTDSKHDFYISPNVVNRKFYKDAPSKLWVSDITYINTRVGFIYLTIIMDVYDRKIIGWALSDDLSTKNTTLPAWEMAIARREIKDQLIFHSDRGSQYANKAFTDKLDSYQCIIRSMSRKANHYDNAMAESFFYTFKRELLHRKTKLLSKKKMKAEIFDFIENWYNRQRIHSSLNLKTIEEFNNSN
ncbi:IS3 family transposase [Flavobacterium sp. Root186]|uniref:IS3 family transposase n=1 Tax=Flavobacterium sp. Root186 TaxID=1736485 RepID=UPI0006FE2758|nr:IS3 family transposase [Flavobacterium sp. Root186]KRB54666.1 transposase [Flavobacterium sp. Root186]